MGVSIDDKGGGGTSGGTVSSVADRSITEAKLANNAVSRRTVAGDAIGSAELGDNAVGNEHLQDEAVGSAELANGAVTDRKIAGNSVASGHLKSNAVTDAKVASGAIKTRHVAAGQIGQAELAGAAVGTQELKDGEVTEQKLARAVRDQLGGTASSDRGTVVSVTASTEIPDTADGDTYVFSGSTANVRLTLPDASGADEVADGWSVAVANQGDEVDVDAGVGDTINGGTLVSITSGEVIRFMKVATHRWIRVASTEAGDVRVEVSNESTNVRIPDTADQDTYRITGSTARTITLPDADSVHVGFFVRIANGSHSTTHTVRSHGAGQIVEGVASIEISPGEVVTLQLVNTGEWELIADTTRGSAGSGTAGAIEDNSLLPAKARASTAIYQKQWRERFDSARNTVGNSFPANNEVNINDVHIFPQDVATGLTWRDIADTSTVINDADAGDVAVFFDRLGWVRVGNIVSGRNADLITALQMSAVPHVDSYPEYYYKDASEHVIRLHIYGIDLRDPEIAEITRMRIRFNGELITSNLAWTAATGARIVTVAVSGTAARNIVNNNPSTVIAELIFHKGSGPFSTENWVTTVRCNMPVLNAIERPALKSDIPSRFETTVGNSPAVLPVGTEDIVGYITKTDSGTDRYPVTIPISAIPASAVNFTIESKNPEQFRANEDDNVSLNLGYVTGTRTLTYGPAAAGQNLTVVLKARGFA